MLPPCFDAPQTVNLVEVANALKTQCKKGNITNPVYAIERMLDAAIKLQIDYGGNLLECRRWAVAKNKE